MIRDYSKKIRWSGPSGLTRPAGHKVTDMVVQRLLKFDT